MPKPEESEELPEAKDATPLKAADSVISNFEKHNAWIMANQDGHANDLHPSEVNGTKAIESFGITLDDGSLLLARNAKDFKQQLTVNVLRSKVGDYAQELGESQRMRWANEGAHKEIRKCNLYTDCVYRDLKIPLPWEEGETPLNLVT